MKKLLFLALGLILFALPLHAQSVDVSGSYSYFRLGNSNGINQNGVSGSIAFNPNRWFGIAGDFGAYHASPGGVSLNTYTYMFGPRLTFRNPTRINPFVQGLVGGSRLSGGGLSSNQLAFSVGGGVDIGILPRIYLRPQVDYVGLHNSGQTLNCTRASLGVAIHF
ncbi:MAG: hypothetical protein DMG36_24005 [Acidobacteria bacterium]|nr:MAG: hypothetical protein DMG36_24005 [Acidobacteriota bacterium]